MNSSPTIGELAKALVAAQAEFKVADKDAVNPHFKSKFASYESIHDATVPALNAHGITLLQPAFSGNGMVGIRTILLHASGEWTESEIAMPMPGKVQEAGSLLSYLKRYSLADAVGAKVAELDDDAESIERPARVSAPSAPAKVEVSAADKMRAAVTKAVPVAQAAAPAREVPADVKARKEAIMSKLRTDFADGGTEQISKWLGRKVTTLEGFTFKDIKELEKAEKALEAFARETEDFFEQAAAIHQEGLAAKAAKEKAQ